MSREVGVATVAKSVAIKRFVPGSFFAPAHEVRALVRNREPLVIEPDRAKTPLTFPISKPNVLAE